jgi:hypothetical protein
MKLAKYHFAKERERCIRGNNQMGLDAIETYRDYIKTAQDAINREYDEITAKELNLK